MASGPSHQKRTGIGLFVLAFLMGVGYVALLWARSPRDQSPQPAPEATPPAMAGPTRTLRPTRTPSPTATPTPTATPNPTEPSPTPRPVKVGIVAGHWRNDSGAVCPDGLQEVTVNLDVGSRVVDLLQDAGYEAELLPEFSKKLTGYEADAFVSIHADSCEVPGLSGFKVARVAASAIPEVEDRLVACLTQEYAQGTGLSFHRNSITFDMTDYHAFREIDPQTPGAIIELGFMDADRELLTEDSARVARAVVRGIRCFLEGE